MASLLMNIQSHVNQYIQMICAIYDVDVDICDNELIRIAGTGKNNRMIGKKLTSGRLSKRTMAEKQPIILKSPLEEELCMGCINQKHCATYGRMCFPLVFEDEVYGAISITALTPEQGGDLMERKDKFILFMQTICDLITLKVREHQDELIKFYNIKLQERLINVINDGLMILDEFNQILFINQRCEKILGCNLNQIQYLSKIKQLSVTPVKQAGAGSRAEYRIKIRDTKIRLTGHTYDINAIDPSKINRIFVFTDIRTLHESLTPNDEMNQCTFGTIIGESASFRDAVAACKKVACSMTPVLLVGEVGSGKEIFGRAIHNESTLRHNQFIRMVRGSAIQELLEKNVFDRAQLTGNQLMLKNDLLEGNTLYIDEISNLSIENQSILLAIIQSARHINTRVICSTSESLKQLVESGDFHPDLYYSLDVYTIVIPPMRSRGNDIQLFANHYLKIANQHAHKNISLSKAIYTMFLNYSWRGNIREIENTITYIVEHSGVDEGELTPDQLPSFVRQKFEEDRNNNYNLEQAEKQLIIRALNDLAFNSSSKAMVAKELGISSATLYRKLKQYNISQNMQFAAN